MPNEVTLESTSDSQEQVAAALGVEAPPAAVAPVTELTAEQEEAAEREAEEREAAGEKPPVVPAAQPEHQPGVKRKTRSQVRIEELTQRVGTEVGRASVLEAENAALRKRLEQSIVPGSTVERPVERPSALPPAPLSAEDTPDLIAKDAKPFSLDDFDTVEEFTREETARILRVNERTRRANDLREQAERTTRENLSRAQQSIEAAFKDYDTHMIEAAREYPDYIEATHVPLEMSDTMIDRIVRAGEVGPHITYKLAKDPALRQEILKLGETQQARDRMTELITEVKIERRGKAKPPVAAAPAVPGETKPPLSRAPAPPPTVAGAGPGTVPTSKAVEIANAGGSYQEFVKRRTAERKAAGKPF